MASDVTRSDSHRRFPEDPRGVGKRDYALGFFTAGVLALMLFLFLGYLIGFARIYDRVCERFGWKEAREHAVYLPEDVLQELVQLNAVVDNAGNPTHQREHDTLLVKPDEEMGYVLRPAKRIRAYLLRAKQGFNWDPPVLHLDANATISDRLRDFIQAESRLSYTYTVSKDGCRMTIPKLHSDKKILVVGDSVAFGVGVDDEHTISSFLQQKVDPSFQIVNAAIGGYDGFSCFKMAKKMSENEDYIALIYIACQNDFISEDRKWTLEANDVLEKLSKISYRFNNRVIILLHTYMEYTIQDVFLENGWSDSWIQQTDELSFHIPQLCRSHGFSYVDWSAVVDAFYKKEASIFSRFALYCDHAHLSPLGNRLAAEELYARLEAFPLRPLP